METVIARELTAHDRCDKCSAAARVIATFLKMLFEEVEVTSNCFVP